MIFLQPWDSLAKGGAAVTKLSSFDALSNTLIWKFAGTWDVSMGSLDAFDLGAGLFFVERWLHPAPVPCGPIWKVS